MSNYAPVAIALNGTTSAAINLGATALRALGIPSAMTNTSIKIQGCETEGGTYRDLYYNGVLVSVPATVSTWQGLPPAAVYGYPYIKLVCTGVGNEAAARELTLLTEGIL